MTAFPRSLIALLLAFTFYSAQQAAGQEKIEWHGAASFEVEGMGWAKTAGPFDRLPDSAKAKVNSTAWNLSKESAGICVRFITDAPSVSARWSLTSSSLAMRIAAGDGVDIDPRPTAGPTGHQPWIFVLGRHGRARR